MSDVHRAKPNDVFVDPAGKLWRVTATWSTPTIIMREVESLDRSNPEELHGGVNGCMWDGFRKIYESTHPDHRPVEAKS
jgi:hypothetical protein